MTKNLSDEQQLAICNLYGQLISNLYSMDRGEEAGAQQMFYDYSKQYLEELSSLENYSDFKEHSEMPIVVSLNVNTEIAHIATQLKTPSTFPLNEFYTKSFKRFFPNYKEWVSNVHMQDVNDVDEIMLNDIIEEMEQMKKIIIPNIPEGIDALKDIDNEIQKVKKFIEQ